jgi:ketosteroid isomerase-like protein
MVEVDKVSSGHGVAAEIVAIADDWARAIAGNDAERIASVMADEWVIVSESGISTKEDFLSLVRSGALAHSAMDRITHPRIRVYGDTAIFTARVTNTTAGSGSTPTSGRPTCSCCGTADGNASSVRLPKPPRADR